MQGDCILHGIPGKAPDHGSRHRLPLCGHEPVLHEKTNYCWMQIYQIVRGNCSAEQLSKLCSSLREFGFIIPVIIDWDYSIIAGHGRVLAAKEEGIAKVPCVFADFLTEVQKKVYILADNRMALDAGFHLAGVCIWVKNSLVLGRSDYQWQHEPVLFGWKKGGKRSWYSDRSQTTIWNYDKPKRNKNQPTFKPLDLLSYPICNSSH